VLDPARDDHASVQVGEPPDGSSGMNDAPPPPSPPALAPAPTRPRLEFLDAVRGIAAFTVAVQHSLDFNYPSYVRWSHEVFRPGEWGVVLFFISSGFIVPVSLERYNSVGRFWIGRFFRLYPLYWAVSAAALILFAFNRYALGGDYTLHWVRATAANLTMAQEFIGQPHVLGQAWTLSYELVFYGVVSVLFLLGLHKSPGWFVVAGLSGALLLGGVIPLRMVTGGTPGDREVVVLTAVLAAGLAVWLLRGSWRSGVLAAGMLLAVVPLVANQRVYTIGPSGADVTAVRPLRVVESGNFIRQTIGTQDFDTPLRLISRAEYMQMGNKTALGVANAIYYDSKFQDGDTVTNPGTGYGNLFVYVTPF
jgi:hypothetical protein